MIELANILQTYGPWGIVVLQFVVIRVMAKHIEQLHAQSRQDAITAVSSQKEETKTIVTALVETRDALRAFKDAMEALAQRL